jgi:hypothetical protein
MRQVTEKHALRSKLGSFCKKHASGNASAGGVNRRATSSTETTTRDLAEQGGVVVI